MKTVIAVLIALFAAYAYAQSSGGKVGKYQVSADTAGAGGQPGGHAWRIDTETGALWYCHSIVIPPACDLKSPPAQ